MAWRRRNILRLADFSAAPGRVANQQALSWIISANGLKARYRLYMHIHDHVWRLVKPVPHSGFTNFVEMPYSLALIVSDIIDCEEVEELVAKKFAWRINA